MAEKDLTDSNTSDDYTAPQPPSREEAAAGAVLVASQPGSRPDALVGNGGAPQAGARLEQLADSAKQGEVNDPSLPPLGPGSGAPKIEGTRQSSEVATSREEAWSVSDGADVPDSDEEKLVVQAEKVGGKAAGKDGIAVPAAYQRLVYEDGSVANILIGTEDNPRPDVDTVVSTKGSVPMQPNQEAEADRVADAAAPAEEPAPKKAKKASNS